MARTYACLGQAPSLLLTAALEDALAVPERPNMPGTSDEWPNWSIALPAPLEDLMADPRARGIADGLSPPGATGAAHRAGPVGRRRTASARDRGPAAVAGRHQRLDRRP